jgi:virginiamycin B lyase
LWNVPTIGSRPHDPLATKDDAIWWTGRLANRLGRLDPSTGKVSEWPSPSGPKSEPYGIVFSKGALWYNESFAKPNTIVRFDPATEKF